MNPRPAPPSEVAEWLDGLRSQLLVVSNALARGRRKRALRRTGMPIYALLGQQPWNMTLWTLYRLADALGCHVHVEFRARAREPE